MIKGLKILAAFATETETLPRYHLWYELLHFKFYQLFSFICCVGIFQIPQYILSLLRGFAGECATPGISRMRQRVDCMSLFDIILS
jgi:hypothetical protein